MVITNETGTVVPALGSAVDARREYTPPPLWQPKLANEIQTAEELAGTQGVSLRVSRRPTEYGLLSIKARLASDLASSCFVGFFRRLAVVFHLY